MTKTTAPKELAPTYAELLDELRSAHKIIQTALHVMTTEQKVEWGNLNAFIGVHGEGITRFHERNDLIERALL